ncbi:BatA and WFA domain-containing protein [Flavobacterium paronense]|uniref:BatA and WFA domain-containing protein n=1 Tax=Flavobacterium paronense TaxID=1392775 RepID=A0ABV5GIF1_9FLAO|nr:BatA and WFA domain-containing protein [Flavobacterium paronense]MDN3677264.1 BatA and WFA domain-containing protein [Flavobacterium paronense]
MQFKHPEVLYFLFLLVIPILVHLFQLRRFKKEYFTNVQFLKELSVQTRKSSTIKKWLLLLTRLLLLTFLILAFAQPFFAAKDSKKNTNEMYIILDNSYSMQAKGKKGELLKRAVQDLLEHTPDAQNFSLITTSDTYWNTDIKSVQKDLQDLKYSASAFRLDNLIAKVNARKSAFNKDIIVITDAVGLETNQTKSFRKEDNVYFIIPEAEQKNNIAIDSVYIQQTLDSFYDIGIKLSANGADFKDIPISLYNKNKLVAKTLLNFETNTKTINFTIPKEDFHGYVSIADKGLAYDNTYYFSISKPSLTNVISIGDADKSNFLARIYTNDEFNFNNFPLANLDYNLLEKQDAIVLNELKDIPQALQTTLKSFVTKGGNLIVIPAQESNTTQLNSFMVNFGTLQFKTATSGEKKVTKINFNHPLFSSVFEKKIDNFQYPSTKTAFGLTSTTPAILTYDDQSTFLTSLPNDLSSVYVFAAPIDKANSNFQNSPLIVPTFYNMAQSSQKTSVTAMIIGENKPFVVDALLSKDEILTVKNNAESFIPIQQLLNTKVKMTFNDSPTEAGNFSIFNGANLVQNISFNYNRTESNLALANPDVASNFKEIDAIETVFNTIQTDRTDTQIWKWFVILTLLFLALELLIQKFVK